MMITTKNDGKTLIEPPISRSRNANRKERAAMEMDGRERQSCF